MCQGQAEEIEMVMVRVVMLGDGQVHDRELVRYVEGVM